MPFGGTPQADETDGDSSSDVPPVAVERIEAEDVPDNETVYLTMRRIKKIENIDVTKCRSLSVISCILEDMRGVQGMINLEVLELYQNQIKKIECLEGMTKLESLDLSFNKIRRIENLSDCVNVKQLRFASNKIEVMEGFDGLAKLEELECGSNRIRNVSGITNEMGKSLKQLWLGRNKIASMLLPYMPALEILSFQCNRLENWDDDLSIKCPNLKELYVSENHLPNPPCSIIGLKQLHTLDLGNNKIQKLDFIGQMIWLKELWLNGNDIQELEEVRKLSTLVNLDTIYLEHNPIKDQLGPGYRQAVLDILPNLKQIDAIYLGQIVVT